MYICIFLKANEILSDPAKRAAYDQKLKEQGVIKEIPVREQQVPTKSNNVEVQEANGDDDDDDDGDDDAKEEAKKEANKELVKATEQFVQNVSLSTQLNSK